MELAGLQKLTLLDFPGKTAATVFTPGCNFRCPFCHNKELVLGTGTAEALDSSQDDTVDGSFGTDRADRASIRTRTFPVVSLDGFFAFLDTRKGLLDGVCITGGEPLLQHGIADFCRNVQERGFLIKLDTNGSFPERLKQLVEDGLVDYVAMDVKNDPANYGRTIGIDGFDIEPISSSIACLLKGMIDYEFRTTLIREFHDEESLCSLAAWIEGAHAWYLQNFVDSAHVLIGEGRLHGLTPEEIAVLLPALRRWVPNVAVRGV